MLSKLLKYSVGLILLIAATSWAIHIPDLEPTDDAYVASWMPDTNLDDQDLQCYHGADEARIFIRFALPDSPPIGETWIYEAWMRLYVHDRLDGYSADFCNVAGPWTEENITWNNQPSSSLSFGSFYPEQGQWTDINAAFAMREWYSYGSLTNYGFCLKFIPAGECGFWAYDKESFQEDYLPYMDVTYVVVTPSDFNLTQPPDGTEYDVGIEQTTWGAIKTGLFSPSNGSEFDIHETKSHPFEKSVNQDPQPMTDISGDRVSYDVTFQWQASTTDGPGNITYHLLVDNNPGFGSPEVDVDGISSTTYTHSFDVTEDITYYWRVIAKEDQLDVETTCMSDFDFFLDYWPN